MWGFISCTSWFFLSFAIKHLHEKSILLITHAEGLRDTVRRKGTRTPGTCFSVPLFNTKSLTPSPFRTEAFRSFHLFTADVTGTLFWSRTTEKSYPESASLITCNDGQCHVTSVPRHYLCDLAARTANNHKLHKSEFPDSSWPWMQHTTVSHMQTPWRKPFFHTRFVISSVWSLLVISYTHGQLKFFHYCLVQWSVFEDPSTHCLVLIMIGDLPVSTSLPLIFNKPLCIQLSASVISNGTVIASDDEVDLIVACINKNVFNFCK